jgi:hypothetical protein
MKRGAIVLGLLLAVVLPYAGCSQQAQTVPVRSLERSGRASFVCLYSNNVQSPGVQLDTCFSPASPFAIGDYFSGPHVLALVTQTTRGEVAVIDVTAQSVLDADPSTPGYNFLPLGALPTDIVSTPGGNASFVASGDPLRPGIFAIPSASLPGHANARGRKATLASWPACSLPFVPTELTIVADSTGSHPGRCDANVPATAPTPGFDLSNETALFGRLKIVATLPENSSIVVIDAQELLARAPGTFDPCPIEGDHPIKLQAVLPGAPDLDAGSDGGAPEAASSEASADAATADDAAVDGSTEDAGGASDGAVADAVAEPDVDPKTCSGRITASPPPSVTPHPAEMALADDGRLFISDDQASVIHVLDATDPCAITERDPLLPYSAVDPTRAVVTSAVAVSPLTTDMKRFVYAVDARGGGNVMVFDVSPGTTTRRPLLRPDVLVNPFEPLDRLSFSSAVQGLVFATRELPRAPTGSAVLPRAIKCDPSVTDPNNPAFAYRPTDFTTDGAHPRKLRGTFGFAALSDGRIAVVDVEDYDQACRRPATSDDSVLGCPMPGTGTVKVPLASASGEASCNIVERHRIRSNVFFANAANAGRHAPAMQTQPALYDKTGTLLSTDPLRMESRQRPRMLGPALVHTKPDGSVQPMSADTRAVLASITAGSGIPEDPSDPDLNSDPAKSQRNWAAFDLREPRAHFDQTWFATYEGVLPPFVGRRGRFQCAIDKPASECEGGTNPSGYVLFDSSVGFCDQGAQGVALAEAQGMSPPSGDIVQVMETLPDPADPYWTTVEGVCSHSKCESVYGTPDDPRDGRDFPIDTAYEDRLVLRPNPDRGRAAPLSCCFPYPIAYTVRAGKQWLVIGSTTGYLHREIPDPTASNLSTARCILSCDLNLQLRNSRAVEIPRTIPDPADMTKMIPNPAPKYDDDSRVFRNPEIRFVLWKPVDCPTSGCVQQRDTYFAFIETGGFIGLEAPLSSLPVMVQSVRFVRGIDQLALPDSVSQGLMLFDLGLLSSSGVRVFN